MAEEPATATANELETGRVHSASSAVGTQREYESVLILKPDTGKPQIQALIERMQGAFQERGGILLKIDNWGMRVLAFPVQRCRKGIYLYWRFLGGSDMVAEFERNARLSERVIRFYTIRVDDDVDPNARPSEVTEDLLDTVSEPGPDPDDVARELAEERARLAAEAEAADDNDDDDDRDRDDDDRDDDNDNDDREDSE